MHAALPVGAVGLVSEDPRRRITEAVLDLPGGGCCRVGEITVGDQIARLGDHHHPDTEMFIIRQGSGTLYTASAENTTDVACQSFQTGDTIVVPAGTVHTFLCNPGTVLTSIANQPFTKDWIVGCRLDLDDLLA
jgi:quercetin dioxygenase-like cupin family protein